MPSVTRTWYDKRNVNFPDVTTNENACKSLYWVMKQLLKGGATATGDIAVPGRPAGIWTVYGSSDGVTAAMDGVDRWGDTFDATKLVFNFVTNNTTPHSWIILHNSALGLYLYMGLSPHQASAYNWLKFGLMRTAPTLAATPTHQPISPAASQLLSFGSSDLFSGVAVNSSIATWDAAGANKLARGHIAVDPSGHLVFFANVIGEGKPRFVFFLAPTENVGGNDPHPWVAFQEYVATGTLSTYSGAPFQASAQGSSAGRCFARNGQPAGAFILTYRIGASGDALDTTKLTGSISPTLGQEFAYPALAFSHSFTVYDAQSPIGDLKGRVIDFELCPQKTVGPDMAPATGTPTHYGIGRVWVPMPGVPLL